MGLIIIVLTLSFALDLKAQDTPITFVGIWDRARPLVERAARETKTSVRFLPGEISSEDIASAINMPNLMLLLNIRPKSAMNLMAQLARVPHPQVRLVQLDQRDGHAGLLKSDFMVQNPEVRAYWKANGLVNMKRLLVYLKDHYLGQPGKIEPPAVIPDHGFYRPGQDELISNLDELKKKSPWKENAPKAAVLIQQSFWITRDVRVIDAMIHALEKEGFNVATLFSENQAWMRNALTDFQADILIEDRHGSPWKDAKGNLLSSLGAPYLRPISMLAYTIDEWRADPQGLAVRDRTMFMALQEIHGTIEPMVVGGLVHSVRGFKLHEPIPNQINTFAKRAKKWAILRAKKTSERKIALIYYNKSLGKSDVMRGSPTGAFLDMPKSMASFLNAMKSAGYHLPSPPSSGEKLLEVAMNRGRNLGPWAQAELEKTVDAGDVVLIPAKKFRKWLGKKLDPVHLASLKEHFGPAPGKIMVVTRNGEEQIVLPVIRFGNVVLAPQPERGSKQDRALLHSREVPPPYNYLAFYWWLEEEFGADAICHFGTHGSLELLPGKEAGLTDRDWGAICLSTLPVVNLWIMDNLGEASLSRRRSFALLSDHMPPPAVQSGLHDSLRSLHEDIHKFNSLETGILRREFRKRIADKAEAQGLLVALGLERDEKQLLSDEEIERVGDQLHDIEQTTTPMTLHVLGQPVNDELMASYLVSCLRQKFIDAVDAMQKLKVKETSASKHDYQSTYEAALGWVDRCILKNENPPASLRSFIVKGRHIHQNILRAQEEVIGLLRGLDGHYLDPGPGPDPIRNPKSIPGGRNLYGLNPEEIPTRPSWEVAKILVDELLATKNPTKVGLDLNGMNTMRDFGVMEGQIFYLLGVQPVWNESEIVVDVKLIPREQLGRDRVDVFIALGGTYKENFPSRVKLLDKAVRLASRSPENSNGVRAGTKRQESALLKHGFSETRAKTLSLARIFGSKPGEISGTKILDLVPRSGVWETDEEITSVYLDSMGYVYSGKHQGRRIDGLYQAAIQGTDTIVRVWASNMTSQLSNHHAYEYLGGLSMAVKALSGKEPEAFIADVRDPEGAQMRSFEEVLSSNLHSELLNRRWIEGMKNHGYAGAGMMAELVKNTFGWDVTRSSSVPESVWGEIDSVYLKDRYELGLKEWFDEANPHALQEIAATMLEAIRKDYWQASKETRHRIAQVYAESVVAHDLSAGLITGGNKNLEKLVRQELSGPGDASLQAAFDQAMSQTSEEDSTQKEAGEETVYGPTLEETESHDAPATKGRSVFSPLAWIGGVLFLVFLILGYRRKTGGIV